MAEEKIELTEEQIDKIVEKVVDRLENDKNLHNRLGQIALKGLDPYLQKVGGIQGLKNLVKGFLGIDI